MDRLSELSLKEEAKLLSQYADEPLTRAILAIDLLIRRAVHRLLSAAHVRRTEAA